MAKYILIYKGAATDMSDMSKEQQKAVFDKWQAWIKTVGKGLVDVGTPFGEGGSVVDDGSQGHSLELSGYSIVKADSLEAAKKLCQGHPYLSEGKGKFAIDVYELMPVPF
jgi:hypothetical protein